MKKFILLLVVALATLSCDFNDDSYSYSYEFLPVDSAEIPVEMLLGEEYKITLNYTKPNSCYSFYDMYYDRSTESVGEGDDQYYRAVRTIAVINRYEDRNNCEEINEDVEAWFTFVPATTGPYVFKFWQGEDENGEDIYLEYETEVVE